MTLRCWRRVVAAAVLGTMLSAGAGVIVRAFQPPEGQSEFVPVSELPPEDRLPAAPLLIGAYAFVWVLLFLYVWSIWKRLRKVDEELGALSRRLGRH